MESYYKIYNIKQYDILKGGIVASLTKRELKKRKVGAHIIKKVTIGVYEAEINVVIHSFGGKAYVLINDHIIDIRFIDKGPGIEDIETAMIEGFSTANSLAIENGFGAGMGLPNIKAVSDRMTIESNNKGTNLHIQFFLKEDDYEN